MPYTLTKEFTFEASHMLPMSDGKEAGTHGHSWRIAVIFKGDVLRRGTNEHGMLMGYGVINSAVRPIIDAHLDHKHLNTLLDYPTNERLAEWLFGVIRDAVPENIRHMLHAVEVFETCAGRCRYEPPKELPAETVMNDA